MCKPSIRVAFLEISSVNPTATNPPSPTSCAKPPQLAREFSAPDLGFQSFGFALAGGSLGSKITGPASNAIRVISDRVSGLTLSVAIVRQVVGEDEITPAPDHPLSLLLQDPTGYSGGSAQFSTADMLKILTSQILSTGEGYLLVIKNGLGVPSELWVQAPGSITPIIEAGRVVAYQSNQNGKLQKLDASEVVRMYNPDPANPWAAKSTLADHVMDLESDYFLRQHVRRRFESDAAPRTVLETLDANESLPSPEELQSFNAAWRSSMSSRHGTNSGGISILKPGWSAKSLDGSTDYLHLVEMLKQSERTLLHAFGVPRPWWVRVRVSIVLPSKPRNTSLTLTR